VAGSIVLLLVDRARRVKGWKASLHQKIEERVKTRSGADLERPAPGDASVVNVYYCRTFKKVC
jgi:hypothetical protein